MKYYKILKGDVLVGIGRTDSTVPSDDKSFTYVKITEKQYEKLEKEFLL